MVIFESSFNDGDDGVVETFRGLGEGAKDERGGLGTLGAVAETFLGPEAETVGKQDEFGTLDDVVTSGASDTGGDGGGDDGKGSRSGREGGESR